VRGQVRVGRERRQLVVQPAGQHLPVLRRVLDDPQRHPVVQPVPQPGGDLDPIPLDLGLGGKLQHGS
jgi:hypothetical protein